MQTAGCSKRATASSLARGSDAQATLPATSQRKATHTHYYHSNDVMCAHSATPAYEIEQASTVVARVHAPERAALAKEEGQERSISDVGLLGCRGGGEQATLSPSTGGSTR